MWAAGYSRSKDGDVSQNRGDNDMLILRINPDNIVVNSLSLGGSGIDLAHETGLYIGVWSSPVNFEDGASSEVDYYGGYGAEFGPVGVDVGVISYQYPGSIPNSSFEEMYLGLSTTLSGVDFGATHYEGASSAENATEFSLGTSLGDFGFAYTLGEYDNTGDYFSFIVSTEILDETWPVEVALMYTEMDLDDPTAEDEDGVVLSVSKSF